MPWLSKSRKTFRDRETGGDALPIALIDQWLKKCLVAQSAVHKE
jgi:hypothetical protein